MIPSTSMRLITSRVCFMPMGLPCRVDLRGARQWKYPRQDVPSAGRGARVRVAGLIYLKVTSRCSTEPRIDACEAEESRITGFAFAHSLRVAACDFHVSLRGSLDEFVFVEYIRDSDFPLFVGSIDES